MPDEEDDLKEVLNRPIHFGHGFHGPEMVCSIIERNFPANIITLIDLNVDHANHEGLKQAVRLMRAMAEKAVLQIDRHNEGKDFSSVATLKAYAAGEGRLP